MTSSRPALDPEAFWRAVSQCTQRALQTGALQPIATRPDYVTDRGVELVVRVSDNLRRKQQAPTTYKSPRGPNPFLPPDPGLTIGELPPGHLAVLNKFNVLADHVLVISRDFVHQEARLTADDFAAVAPGLANGVGLAFYNAGEIAGASQAHRHFQLVPLPLGRQVDIPISVLLAGAASGLDTVQGLRFRHAFLHLDADPGDAAAFGRACWEAYRGALSDLRITEVAGNDDRLPPYNLLLTDRWLLLVPRSTERFREISINGLGYAGSLFVSTAEKLAQVKAAGPMSILEAVSMPVT